MPPYPTVVALTLISELHAWGAWLVIVANGAAGVWSLGATGLPFLRARSLWFFTAAAQAALVVQVSLGVALVSIEDREVDDFHMFYGFVAIVAIAILYSYRQQMRHRLHLLYGLGSLFVMGLAIRAVLIDAAA